MKEAATLPLNGLTADGALSAADVSAGQTLLVTGAVGGVGGFVLQLAKLRGLRTLAVASGRDERLARELGATDFIARTDSLAERARTLVPGGVDA
ncbi:MAG: zinc-binding dehydrogenase [Actinomycetota bacterium]|nr:zinc-binding dehydrogenase [Actinomycetota bacterium]